MKSKEKAQTFIFVLAYLGFTLSQLKVFKPEKYNQVRVNEESLCRIKDKLAGNFMYTEYIWKGPGVWSMDKEILEFPSGCWWIRYKKTDETRENNF